MPRADPGRVLADRAERHLQHRDAEARPLADGASRQELGGRMGLDPSGLVGAIDELERLGLVARRRDDRDRRRDAGGLPEEGPQTLRRARRLVTESARKLLGALDESEVGTLVELFGRVAEAESIERL